MELLEKKANLQKQLEDVKFKRQRLDIIIYGIEKSIRKIDKKLDEGQALSNPTSSEENMTSSSN